MLTAIPIAGCLTSCIACMYFVEKIAKEKSDSMALMTFATFTFIALEGLIFTSKFFSVENKIPFRGYIPTVVIFFLVNLINNLALSYHVPVPLHIIFRSGSLLASLLMTRLLQGKRYSSRKYLSVLLITMGIIICTLATAQLQTVKAGDGIIDDNYFFELCVGILMLTSALIASAYLAICQENMYNKYGKHAKEAVFIVHAASLPFFAFVGSQIYKSAQDFSSSAPVNIIGFNVPHMWVLLGVTCLMQWACINFVYQLTAVVDSLTVTLVVTLRKFLSLIISIFWFGNPFTLAHWIGAGMVFIGTISFTDIRKDKEALKKME